MKHSDTARLKLDVRFDKTIEREFIDVCLAMQSYEGRCLSKPEAKDWIIIMLTFSGLLLVEHYTARPRLFLKICFGVIFLDIAIRGTSLKY